MVNENLIPIENKKPVETVYDIKNEIPAFEEFMKTYENDVNLNYDDLSDGSIGEVKEYGPCSWHNPKCTCYVSSGYVPLNTACPSCPDRTPHQWVHRGCGGQSYISRNIRIRCNKCYEEHHWKDWSFKCNNVRHTGYWTPTSSNSFLNALSVAAGMNSEDGGTTDIIADISIKLIEEARRERR